MASPPPQNPAGEFVSEREPSDRRIHELVAEVAAAPAVVRAAVAGLSGAQLDVPYRNWTIRQIVHHVADSHVNSYVRFKWALTEDRPTIKAYFEDRWVALADSRTGDVAPALALLDAVHGRWAQLMRAMTPDQWRRVFHHPESGAVVRLDEALPYYAWHARHHAAQIRWLRDNGRA